MRKLFLIVLLLLGGLGAWAFASRNAVENADTAQRYRTETTSRGPIVATVSATGTIAATTTVIVGSQLSGQVVEILADHNSVVRAGQVLARLNRDTLLARRDSTLADLKQARAARLLNDAQTEKVRAELSRARAQAQDTQAQAQRVRTVLADAETTYARQENLKSRGIATEVTMQNATTQRDSQRAALLSAEAQIASSLAQIDTLQAELKVVEAQKASSEAQIARAEAQVRLIEVDLANSEVRSPVDGVVVQRNVELGQTVAASLQAPILFLVAQDLTTIEVNVNLDETDVGRVKPGQQVEFTVSAYPARTFNGVVKLVRLGSQTVQNVVIYTTVVSVQNNDMALLPGMTANARIFTERKADVLRVSNAALRWQPAGSPRAVTPPGGASPTVSSAGLSDDPAGPFTAPQGQGGARGGGPGGVPGGQLARQNSALIETLKTELSLDSQQYAEVQALGKAMVEAIQKAGNDPAARREIARTERQKFVRGVDALLSTEQREKFRVLRQQRQQEGGQQANAAPGVPGRVHILDEKGNPKPVNLRIGSTDGSWSEVVGGELKPGESLVVGLAAPARARQGSTFRFGF
ncbi:AcrA Membrane-fusion protein [Rhabdaerophilaceae bacterium]